MIARNTFISDYTYTDCVDFSATVSGAYPVRFPGQ